ncbi:M24 family metallopeptidase [Candidatus Omnitrophota bacterium]
MNYSKRRDGLIRSLESKSLHALIVRKKQNISYLVGAKGEDAALFISSKKNFLVTDSRYQEEYKCPVKDYQLEVVNGEDLWPCVERISKKTSSKRIGFESHSFSYSEYLDLKKRVKNVALVPVKNMVESLRMLKDDDEVACIKKACEYGCDIMDYGLKMLRPARSEIAVKTMIEGYIAKKRLKAASFDIIVASGKNASMPHASASKKKIKDGEMVIIDLGAMNYGYNSDLTRTAFLGRINRKYLRIYNIVLDAQKKAIEHIKPGVPVKYIDAISRKYILDKGFGRHFIHSLGHGIGLETHELPRVSRHTTATLKKNMTVTIEPGIYIPGWGGIRIEDVVLVTEDGSEILTQRCEKTLCR